MLDSVAALRDSGRYVSIDYLGEDVTDADDADATVRAYLDLLDALGRRPDAAHDGVRPLEVSLKLSALGQSLDRDGEKIARENARTICERREQVGAWVTVDAEDHTTTDSTLSIVARPAGRLPLAGNGFAGLPAAHAGRLRGVRRGRGPDPAVQGRLRRTGVGGLPGPAEVTDSYLRCLRVLMAGSGYPMVASHDPVIIDAVPALARESGRGAADFEYQMLYGIRDGEQRRLADAGNQVRVYVPFGTQWYGYFMRRLAERPANLAFFLRALAERRR